MTHPLHIVVVLSRGDGVFPARLRTAVQRSGWGGRVSRWGDIIRARRERAGGGGDDTGGGWGPWHEVASTAGIQVRVRRATVTSDGVRELYLWSYEFKSLLPRPIAFRYKVHLSREGPYDRLVRELEPGEFANGSVILPTAGPIWIDAQLVADG